MKAFVIGGLDSPKKKKKAEALLKKMGYWNNEYRGACDFIMTYSYGDYQYHSHNCGQTPITLEELQDMANPYPKEMMVWDDYEKQVYKHLVLAKVEHEGRERYVSFAKNTFYLWKHAKPIEEELTHEERIQRLEDELKKLKG